MVEQKDDSNTTSARALAPWQDASGGWCATEPTWIRSALPSPAAKLQIGLPIVRYPRMPQFVFCSVGLVPTPVAPDVQFCALE